MTQPLADLRAMTPADVSAVHELAQRSFGELERRMNLHPGPADGEEHRRAGHLRIAHLVETDPQGAIVAEGPQGLEGAALAVRREDLWGLSLLIVDPAAQSRRTGSRLLARALVTAEDARGGIILASIDPRALRLYASAGFALHPAMEAVGIPGEVATPPSVRSGGLADLPLTEAVDRAVRGAPHGSDIATMLEQGMALLVDRDRGYAVVGGGAVRLLAAFDPVAAQDLLRAALAAAPAGERVEVDWITADQGWAVPVVLEAGLELQPSSAVFVRGDVGPFAPYIPSGAYL